MIKRTRSACITIRTIPHSSMPVRQLILAATLATAIMIVMAATAIQTMSSEFVSSGPTASIFNTTIIAKNQIWPIAPIVSLQP